MNPARQREIVIEIERVRLIRKRAKTHLRFCMQCGKQSDFISIDEAAALFETDKGSLFNFIRVNSCHFQINNANDAHICLVAFLEAMKTKTIDSRIKLIGDKSK
jgi:hypothetical protein